MKIEESLTRTIKLTELERLDPITITLQNFEPGKGKIGIECYGKSWSAYWGGMSGDPVEQFFVRCSPCYLIGNLAPGLRSGVDDYEGLAVKARAEICTLRRAGELTDAQARDLWEESESVEHVEDTGTLNHAHHKFMQTIFGDDWWYSIPEKPNPSYEYLERIVEAVQQGLQQVIGSNKVAA